MKEDLKGIGLCILISLVFNLICLFVFNIDITLLKFILISIFTGVVVYVGTKDY